MAEEDVAMSQALKMELVMEREEIEIDDSEELRLMEKGDIKEIAEKRKKHLLGNLIRELQQFALQMSGTTDNSMC